MKEEQEKLLMKVVDEYALAFSRRAICKTFKEDLGERKAITDQEYAKQKILNVVINIKNEKGD